MIESADVIVIGSGGLGAATAFHLAKKRALSVALVERLEIGSQTSPRAAGMVSCLRKSDLMIDLVKLAAQKIRQFAEDTGEPLDWVCSGSLKVARRVAGLSIDPVLGEMLAEWLVDGAPPIDLTPLSIRRFGAGPWPDDELITQAAWQYRHFCGAR
ncbi:hypothetical protein LMG22037_06312 [Paraburkholderia phenoliruptrix]|uniref:FAD dependent oxidoreductase domain-containing protein n=1 Tax=Paraburkholderia phenoliruptrix TaxID=252970 RepID=A0A6J5CJY0_9BURK|nr:FAD-dependent oxidoreductase [Paraburkholderia phenoliruptrix]CAB3739652.1 hypothetical protein LMG22037_06312 [Paraburkholderia phenoliruptrix]